MTEITEKQIEAIAYGVLKEVRLANHVRSLTGKLDVMLKRVSSNTPKSKSDVEWSRMSGSERDLCIAVFRNWRKIRDSELIKLAQWERSDFDQALVDRIDSFATFKEEL